jgi:hypothetical protein
MDAKSDRLDNGLVPSREPWPQDPRLDPYRNAVWELARSGRVQGYLTCRVIPTRSFPGLWAKSELLWYQVCWLDGRRERPGEDHGPGWPVVTDLEEGRFVADDLRGFTYAARPVEGQARQRLWARYGPAVGRAAPPSGRGPGGEHAANSTPEGK